MTISIMINGLPGNMARIIARRALADKRFSIVPYSLTGPEITDATCEIEGTRFELIRPDRRGQLLGRLASDRPPICIDFTHPTAVNDNASFYCRNNLPFVMGTTGGDRRQLEQTVTASHIAAVIAPNMAKQIVGLQAMIAWAADTFPGLFAGYRMTVTESHQAGKADTSGTAKALVASFVKMGVEFSVDRIEKIRDPHRQRQLGVPEEHLGGHGWHTYRLQSPDGTVSFRFDHNVNGREIYVDGTLDAVAFLAQQMENGVKGKVFSMIDVLRNLP